MKVSLNLLIATLMIGVGAWSKSAGILPEAFDINVIALIIGCGIWGHFVGLAPEVINIVIFLISTILSMVFGTSLVCIVLPLIRNLEISVFLSIFSMIWLIDSTLKLVFIPKNIAKELYIDVPFYYLSGAALGAIRGYLIATVLFFCISSFDMRGYDGCLSTSISYDALIHTRSVWEFFVPNAIREKMKMILLEQEITDSSLPYSISSESSSKPHSSNSLTSEKTIDYERESVKKIMLSIGEIKEITPEETRVISSMINKIRNESSERLAKRITFLSKRKTITKKVVLGLIVREFTLEVKNGQIIATKEELQMMSEFAIDNLSQATPEYIVQSYAKHQPYVPQTQEQKSIKNVTNRETNSKVVETTEGVKKKEDGEKELDNNKQNELVETKKKWFKKKER